MTTVERSLSARLIAGGILDRFPRLKLVIAHFGGGIAAVKDRLSAKGYRFGTSNVRSRITSKCSTSISPDLKAVCRFALRSSRHPAGATDIRQRLPPRFHGC